MVSFLFVEKRREKKKIGPFIFVLYRRGGPGYIRELGSHPFSLSLSLSLSLVWEGLEFCRIQLSLFLKSLCDVFYTVMLGIIVVMEALIQFKLQIFVYLSSLSLPLVVRITFIVIKGLKSLSCYSDMWERDVEEKRGLSILRYAQFWPETNGDV